MNVCAAPAPASRDPFAEHFEKLFIFFCSQVSVWISAAHQLPQRLFADATMALRLFLSGRICRWRKARHRRYHLLREDIERLFNERELVQLTFAHGANTGDALEQIVPRQRIKDSLRNRPEPVSGSAHTLQQDSESSRGTDMANDVDVADIDAELE